MKIQTGKWILSDNRTNCEAWLNMRTARRAPEGVDQQIAGMRFSDGAAGSLPRAITLMRSIAGAGTAGASLVDLVARTTVPRPTIYRVLEVLLEAGWVERDPLTHRFHLGAEIVPLGMVAAQRHPIARLAATELARVASEIEHPVYLSVRSGFDTVCVAREESASYLQTFLLRVGSRVPFGSGSGGMAILAALPEAETEEVILHNLPRYKAERPHFNEALFREALKKARQRGYTFNLGVFTPAVGGIGAAIFDNSNHPIAAISTAFVMEWIDETQCQRSAASLCAAAGRIAHRLQAGSYQS
jgi:DNA-binding IclR family transcriptional regulator